MNLFIHKKKRFIKITGVRNTANRIFHLVSMEVRFTTDRYELLNEFIGKKKIFNYVYF